MQRVGVILVAFVWASSPVPTGFSPCTLVTLQEAKEILGPKAILHYEDKWTVGSRGGAAGCFYDVPQVPSEGLGLGKGVTVTMNLITKQAFAALPQTYRKLNWKVDIIRGLGDGAFLLYGENSGEIQFLKGETRVCIEFSGVPHDSGSIMPFARKAFVRLP